MKAGAFSAVTAVVALTGNVLGNGLAPQQHHKTVLTEVFSDPDFQLTGVTVSKAGRLFVNYPRWSDHYRYAVVEIQSGKARPFPDQEWNIWNGKLETAASHFVCVQSVVVDDKDRLWIVDAAAPLMGPVVTGGAKLVGIDLASNQIVKTIPIGSDVIHPNSYLNDVRIDTSRDTAYVTDSGAGGIVVVNLTNGHAARKLDGDKSVSPDPDTKIVIQGKPLLDMAGETPKIYSDGIALSPDGEYLYYQALTSSSLYRVKTDQLRAASSQSISPEKIASTFPADGLWMDREGNLYLSGLQQSAVFVRDKDGTLKELISDDRLRWPDTFSEGPKGDIYISTSHLNESPRFNQGKSVRTQPYAIFRFKPNP